MQVGDSAVAIRGSGCGCRSTRPRTCGSRCAASRCTCPGCEPRVMIVTATGWRPGLMPLRAAIVASGSELVRGDRNDRNGPYLASSLLRLGIDPARITVVGDDPADLEAALAEGLTYDLLVVSGGLGPTHDDRTIELLARGGRGRAARRRGAAGRRSRSSRGGSPSASAGPTPTSPTASSSRRRCPTARAGSASSARRPRSSSTTGACVAVALPGPPRELQAALAARARDRAAAPAARARRSAPGRRVLRFYGVSESAVAQSLAAAGGDGDGVDVTICARDFELHVDLFVDDRAPRRAPTRSPTRLVGRCGAVPLLAGRGRDRRARARVCCASAG